MIFGLAVAGQPTAAALIVSAKSLLRFPEVSSTKGSGTRGEAGADGAPASDDVHVITEYSLLGSLMSWTLALAPPPR